MRFAISNKSVVFSIQEKTGSGTGHSQQEKLENDNCELEVTGAAHPSPEAQLNLSEKRI